LTPFGAEWLARMTIATRWRRMDAGGIDDLKEWCDSVEDPVLIVIDVREGSPSDVEEQATV
jgi:hypothetical protein